MTIYDSPLGSDFWQHGKSADCPIYDLHGHMGQFAAIYMPNETPEAMIHTMDTCGVKLLVFSHHQALQAPNLGNQPTLEAVRRFPDRLKGYCVINPNYPRLVAQEVSSFESNRDAYVGFKFLSDYHMLPLTDPRYQPAWEYANVHRLLVLAHTWGHSPYDGAAIVRQVAERYPEVRLLMGHSCSGEWDEAVKIANDFPNVFLELTAVFDDRGILEKFVNEAGSHKMIFGVDLPWFDPHHGIGALLSAKISDDDRHNICHRNAEKLLAPFL